MALTNLEKETIICFNEAEPEAEIFVHNGKMLRDLAKLVEERPDEAHLIRDNGSGGMTYRVPKKWVKIRANRIMSEEERAMRAEIARKNQIWAEKH